MFAIILLKETGNPWESPVEGGKRFGKPVASTGGRRAEGIAPRCKRFEKRHGRG
jgi:hypothetical protein